MTAYYPSSPFPLAANSAITVSPVITTISVLIAPANAARKGLYLYNNSANTIYVSFATTCNSSNFMTFPIATFATWAMPLPIYTGALAGIRNSGTGTIIVTELT